MNFLIFFTTIFTITSAHGTGKVVNFWNELQSVINGNLDRYNKLSSEIAEMESYDPSNLTNFFPNMIVNLKNVRDRYTKTVESAIGVWIFNNKTYDLYKNLAVSNNTSAKINLKKRFDLLSRMIEYSLNKTSTANNEINKIQTTINSDFNELANLLYNLKYSADYEDIELRDKITKEDESINNYFKKWFTWFYHGDIKEAEISKYELKRKLEKINHLVDDTKKYLNWVKKIKKDFQDDIKELDLIFSDLKKTFKYGRKLIISIKNAAMSIKKKNVDELPAENKNQLIIDLDHAVKKIYEKSCLLVKSDC